MQDGGDEDFILPPADYGFEPKLNLDCFFDTVVEIGIPR